MNDRFDPIFQVSKNKCGWRVGTWQLFSWDLFGCFLRSCRLPPTQSSACRLCFVLFFRDNLRRRRSRGAWDSVYFESCWWRVWCGCIRHSKNKMLRNKWRVEVRMLPASEPEMGSGASQTPQWLCRWQGAPPPPAPAPPLHTAPCFLFLSSSSRPGDAIRECPWFRRAIL